MSNPTNNDAPDAVAKILSVVEAHSSSMVLTGMHLTMTADRASALGPSGPSGACRSLKMPVRSSSAEPSILKLVDSASTEMLDVLSRMRTLAVQATWSWLGKDERSFVNHEFICLAEELETICRLTEFNGFPLVGGCTNRTSAGSAIPSADDIWSEIVLVDLTPKRLGLKRGDVDLHSMSAARVAIGRVDAASEAVTLLRTEYESVQSQVQLAIDTLNTHVTERLNASEVLVSEDVSIYSTERSRLEVMQGDSITSVDEPSQFQQSIRAFVQ